MSIFSIPEGIWNSDMACCRSAWEDLELPRPKALPWGFCFLLARPWAAARSWAARLAGFPEPLRFFFLDFLPRLATYPMTRPAPGPII